MGGGDANSSGGIGMDRSGEATTVLATTSALAPIAAPVVYFINGGEKIILTGTLGNAIVSADTDVPLPPDVPAAQ